MLGFRLFAQKSDTVVVERDSINGITYISFDDHSKRPQSISNAQIFLKQLHQAGSGTDFVLKKKSNVYNLGIEHQTFDQYYKGLRVIGAQFKIHGKAGRVNSANGNYANVLDMDATPTINEQGIHHSHLQRF